jgi:hypothetical protein
MNHELEFLLSYTPLLASIATIIVAGLILVQTRQTSKSVFSTLLNDLGEEHTKILQKEIDLKYIPEEQLLDACEMYALSYSDFMERVSYLALNHKIPNEVALKFKSYFEYIQLIMTWYDAIIVDLSSVRLRHSNLRWPSIQKWCNRQKPVITTDKDPGFLPIPMKKLWKILAKESFNVAEKEAKDKRNNEILESSD